MRNPLQEQLLKAGLAKKQQADDAARALKKQRHGKSAPKPTEQQIHAQRAQAERAERDRQLAAEQKAQARAKELRAQISRSSRPTGWRQAARSPIALSIGTRSGRFWLTPTPVIGWPEARW